MQDAVSLEGVRAPDAREDEQLDRLASRAANGDSLAFESIYTATVDLIYVYLVGHLRDETQAEDITSNVFLKAWKSAASYRVGSNNYRRWLFAIARNELRDAWRQQRRTTSIDDAEILSDAGPDLSEQPGYARAEVIRAMNVLTEEQRRVVILRFFGEQSHAEIARVLNKREGAVRVQLLRALRHMRKEMHHAAP